MPGAVIEGRVTINNPRVFESAEDWRKFANAFRENRQPASGQKVREALERDGHDGFIVRGGGKGDAMPEGGDFYLSFDNAGVQLDAPSQPAQVEESDDDQSDADEASLDPMTKAVRDIAAVAARKPRPINKTSGPNPTEAQQAEHATAMREWDREYRAAKKALSDVRDARVFPKDQFSNDQSAEPTPQPYSLDALASAFNLTKPQAVAVDALIKAVGLDTSKIQIVKGGTPGAGALEQDIDAAPAFYSAMARAIEAKMPAKASASQIMGIVRNPQSGVKADELKWAGMEGWLNSQQPSQIAKADVLAFLAANQIQITEITKGGNPQGWHITAPDQTVSGKWLVKSSDYNSKGLQFDTEADARAALLEKTSSPDDGKTRHERWQEPGGEKYRELLLTLPSITSAKPTLGEVAQRLFDRDWSLLTVAEETAAHAEYDRAIEEYDRGADERLRIEQNQFRNAAHFNEPNILVHVRFNERTDAQGRRVLFIEEIQSDWHQAGRKHGYKTPVREAFAREMLEARNALVVALEKDGNLGFSGSGEARRAVRQNDDFAERWNVSPETRDAGNRYRELTAEGRAQDKGVPDAPFKTTWHELALKRMLRYAADGGYEAIAWTTGEQQNDRFDLSKQVKAIYWQPNERILTAETNDGDYRQVAKDITEDKLADFIGKDAAERIIKPESRDQSLGTTDGTSEEAPQVVHALRGADLKVGGSGMKGFYDDILPRFLNKYTKAWGVKVGTTEIGVPNHRADGSGVWEVSPERGRYLLRNTRDSSVFRENGQAPYFDSRNDAQLKAGALNMALRGATDATVHALDITPAMRESVMRGQPLFQSHTMTPLEKAPAEYRNGRLLVSAAMPKGKNAPNATSLLVSDMSAAGPGYRATAARVVQDYPQVRVSENDTPDQILRKFIQIGKDNLRFLWDSMPAKDRERAKLWYAGGRQIVTRLADQYKLYDEQAAGVLALLSPQKDWFMNVDMAERVISIVDAASKGTRTFTADLFAQYEKTEWAKVATDLRRLERDGLHEDVRQIREVLQEILDDTRKEVQGRQWTDLTLEGKAIMVRAIDGVENSPHYRVVTPEGGRGDWNYNQDGKTRTRLTWGPYAPIEKAISVLEDGSAENIHTKLGFEHKVRSFFNNLSDPDDPRFVTIDTHAVAAVHLEPFSGNHPKVERVLGGTPAQADTGLSGLNALYAQMYKDLATELSQELGYTVLPREAQSVTWEQVRMLFEKKQKGDVMKAAVEGIWTDHQRGILSGDEARQRILAQAGGIGRTAWLNTPPGVADDQGVVRAGPVSRVPGRVRVASVDARTGSTRGSPRTRAAQPDGLVTASSSRVLYQRDGSDNLEGFDLFTDTGEQQARLPGDVGDVRETNIATPKLAEEPEFSLTGEVAKRKGVQPRLLFQGEKASVEFIGGGQALLRGMAKADISSAVHEIAHVTRRFLLNRDVPIENRRGVTDADIDTTEKWAGATTGWDVVMQEELPKTIPELVSYINSILASVFDRAPKG
ncbi:MAG TPA: hypothetical protein VNJ04_02565 [Gemmatimonadaceae bacterium]|nr:hypothetical protein [Gemmatimonadaceae bacterium]